MSRFSRIVVLAALMVVAAWVILSAWVSNQPWLNHLWLNVSFMLHQEWFVVALVTLIYATAFLFARWHLIAWPSRLALHQQIGDARLKLDMEPPGDAEKQRKIEKLREMLAHAAKRVNAIRPVDRILWSRGQELANSRHVSEVERELAVLQPAARVRSRQETAEQELRAISARNAGAFRNASALADQVDQELRAISARNAGAVADEVDHESVSSSDAVRLRCLLYEALGTIYSDRDDDNDNLLTWHNKTLWLSGVGILFLISLEGVKRGGGGLLAVGAAGGFMSRLMRTLKRDNVPTDYGAYWTTLFLSPLLGALAGWTGILLVESARRLGVLGEVFKGVTVQGGYGDFLLGLAFLLGFSERLFYGILKPLEARVGEKARAAMELPSRREQRLEKRSEGTAAVTLRRRPGLRRAPRHMSQAPSPDYLRAVLETHDRRDASMYLSPPGRRRHFSGAAQCTRSGSD